MKGREYAMIYGIIILLVVIALVVIVVLYPFLNYRNTTTDKTDFEEFCVFWSLHGYNTKLNELVANGKTYDIAEKCDLALKTGTLDKAACVKCCKKEIVC
jgi:hypothetical protein